jgi:hypothetical protein
MGSYYLQDQASTLKKATPVKRTYLVVISSVIIITVVIVLTLMQVRSVRSGPQASTPTPLGGPKGPNSPQLNPNVMPSVVPLKVTDLSPGVDYNAKGMLIVRHADGNEEAFLIAPNLVDQFISQLPKEDKLVQIISPGSIESAHP